MSDYDIKRHFYSDCQRFLNRYYKDLSELQGLKKIYPKSNHIKWNLAQVEEDIKKWESRANEAYENFTKHLIFWSNWQRFEREYMRTCDPIEMSCLNWAVIF